MSLNMLCFHQRWFASRRIGINQYIRNVTADLDLKDYISERERDENTDDEMEKSPDDDAEAPSP